MYEKTRRIPFLYCAAMVLCQRHPGAAYGVEYQ